MGKDQFFGMINTMNPQDLQRIAAAFVALPVAAMLVLTACSSSDSSAPAPAADPNTVEHLSVEIVDTHPFDDTSFTQGLEVDADGSTLIVGTGQRGESRIYRTTIVGQESDSHSIDADLFGEGITRHNDTVWQLTWQKGVAIKRDATTLEEIGRVNYPGEGWGICSFDDRLIFSDGTDELRVLDPDTFAEQQRIKVTRDGAPLEAINELECVTDPETGSETVYSNLFLSTDIARIDASTGKVTGIIDGSTIPNNAEPDPNNVLNGIAHIPNSDRFYVTGKRWPDLYEVRFVPNS